MNAEQATGRIALIAALPLCACTAHYITADAPKSVTGYAIAPYEAHEECLRLARGDRVEFAFESSEPVDFSLHYHEGTTVVMPIVHDKSRGNAGVFTTSEPHDYCAMWEAGAAGALVDYRIRLRQAGSWE